MAQACQQLNEVSQRLFQAGFVSYKGTCEPLGVARETLAYVRHISRVLWSEGRLHSCGPFDSRTGWLRSYMDEEACNYTSVCRGREREITML